MACRIKATERLDSVDVVLVPAGTHHLTLGVTLSSDMWSGYPPEINSGRWESGTGGETWLAAASVWTSFAGIVAAATGSLAAEIAALTGDTLTGMTSAGVAASSAPFYGWLMTMEATALEHAVACATVAEAWGVTTTGIIPLPVVNENRISEATAESTNAFGQNTPLIAELNREYAQFWTQDATSMLNYDNAVVLATAPKMVPPPPPLTSMAKAAPMLAKTASQAAQQSAQGASRMASATDGLAQATQGGGSQMMSQMMQPMQGAMQAATQAPQQLMKPMQSMMQPLQSMLGQFMKGPQMGGGLGSAFSATSMGASSTGGIPMSSSGMGGGGFSMGGSGGGIGNLGHLAGSTEKTARPIGSLSGVPAPTLGSGGQLAASNNAMTGGGGGGMGGMGAGQQSQQRKSESILAAQTDTSIYDRADVAAEKKMFA